MHPPDGQVPARKAFGPGDAFGPYRILKPLGRGGFAPVFLAEEIHDGKKLRDVALKLFFLPDGIDPASADASAWRDGVFAEARALCRVQHPSVVRFFSVFRDKSTDAFGLAMEYVGGESLDGRLNRLGHLDEREVLEAVAQVAWALSAVHAAGLVHRDVKPANIVCGSFGYKLIDFGVVADLDPARRQAMELEARCFIVGTPGYIAPEILHSGWLPSPASDLYALGITLRKLLTGRLPSEDETVADAETMLVDDATVAVTTEYVPVAPAVISQQFNLRCRPDVVWLVDKLCAPEPHVRPQHADWVAREVERMLAERRGAQSAPAVSDDGTFDRGLFDKRMSAAIESGPELLQHPPLVGRDDAVSVALGALAEARRGRVQVVMFSGPLGVGRTRLLDAIVERAGLSGSRVLRAVCRPERQRLLQPLARAAKALSAQESDAVPGLRKALSTALLHEMLREARAPGSELEVVETALLDAAANAPLILVIDDLQWADPYTLELLRRLCDKAAAEAGARLLILAALRHEPSPSAQLRALLSHLGTHAHSAIRHVPLSPLGADDAAEVVRAVGPLCPALEQAVLRGAEGIPFFLVHGILAWRATGSIVFRNDQFEPADDRVLDEDLPGVATLVQAKLSRQFDGGAAVGRLALRVLAVVALHGGGIDADTLSAVLRPADLGQALDGLLSAGLLTATRDAREYDFPQEMLRQAVLNLVRSRRFFVEVYRSLLDVVATKPGADSDAEFLAYGYDKLGVAEQARHWFGRAMQEAAASGLFMEAMGLGDRLIALIASADERMHVELSIVRLLIEGRHFKEARTRLERLENDIRAERGAAFVEAALEWRILRLRVARGLRETSVRDDELVADADAFGGAAIRCEARLAVAGHARGPDAIPMVTEAIALAETMGPALEFAARILCAELRYEASPPDLTAAAVDLERALAIANATSSIWQKIHTEGDLAVIEAQLGNTSGAIERLRRLVGAAEARGMHGNRVLFLQNMAAFLLREGQAREAAEKAAEVVRLALAAGDAVLGAMAWSLRADALRRLGELDAALVSIDEAIRIQSQRGDRLQALSLLRRAEILDVLHRPDDALRDAAVAMQIAEQQGEQGWSRTANLWIVLHQAQSGSASAADVEKALGDVAALGNVRGGFTKIVFDRATNWLREWQLAQNAAPKADG
ncbi:MAG: protein kinase [Polyangiaceae bacterium]|nr:protein kinase [Polyangiaceae bacterium]